MFISSGDYDLLLKLSSKSANGNDTLKFEKLEDEYKKVIQRFIELTQKDEGDIKFGVENEGILRIIKNNNECLISVITPTDDVGRPFLYKE